MWFSVLFAYEVLKSTGHVQVNNNKVFGTCGSVFCLHMKS